MTSFGRHPFRQARRGAAARSHIADETGDTLIEVLVGALLVALIAGGVLTGYGGAAHLGGQQRSRAQAAALAQADQARLRGLTVDALSASCALSSCLGTTGNQTATQTIDGTPYTITSKSQFISGSGAISCTAGQTSGSADEVTTSSAVQWPPISSRDTVMVHSVVTPSVGGSLVASAITPVSSGSTGLTGLAGVTVTPSGPTTTSPLTTDSSGCAIFAGLTAGSYTVSFTPPAGFVDVNGSTTIPTQTPTVTATQSTYVAPVGPLAQPGGISASFSTTYNGQTVPATGDQFSVQATPQLTPPVRAFGVLSSPGHNAFASLVSSGQVLYPTEAPLTSSYVVEAGSCGDAPAASAGQVSVAVTSGQASTATLPEPALIVLPVTSAPGWTIDDSSSSITYSRRSNWTTKTNTLDLGGTEHTSSTANATAKVTFTGTNVTWVATTGTGEGIANVSLDGGAAQPVDLWSASTLNQQPVYNKTGLTTGSHTLLITVTGTQSHTGGANLVSVDAFTGTSTASLMTTKPTIVITDTDTACSNSSDYPPTQVPTATGGALVNPGLPWGTYTVCVDNGVNHATTTGVANTDYTSGNVVNVNLFSGGAGYGTGTCQPGY